MDTTNGIWPGKDFEKCGFSNIKQTESGAADNFLRGTVLGRGEKTTREVRAIIKTTCTKIAQVNLQQPESVMNISKARGKGLRKWPRDTRERLVDIQYPEQFYACLTYYSQKARYN